MKASSCDLFELESESQFVVYIQWSDGREASRWDRFVVQAAGPADAVERELASFRPDLFVYSAEVFLSIGLGQCRRWEFNVKRRTAFEVVGR